MRYFIMSKLSNKPWGGVDKDELLKYVINNPKKAKDIYLKIEPNWEEDPTNRLSYPIADKSGTIYRYALSSAMTYAKANNETQVINKLKKLYKQFNLDEEGNSMERKVVESVVNEDKSYIGRTDYFDASLVDGEIKLTDLNDNYTMLNKEELKEFIALLKKCEAKLK